MNQKEWHEWRRNGIGSSDAAVIMGVSPWRTPLQLWENKVFGISEQLDNASMKRGRDLEETARQEFEKLVGTIVAPSNVVHPGCSWMRASLDGIDVTGKIIVEIKCPNKDDHLTAAGKKVPEKYYPQCQHQLEVTGSPSMYYFSFDGKKGVVVEVARDQKYIDDMFQKEKEFWSLVVNQTPPETSHRDKISMEGNKEWTKTTNEWRRVNQELKSLEEREKVLRENMISLSEARNANGNSVNLTKSICKGNIDYKTAIIDYLDNMRSHYPHVVFPEVVVETYRKASFVKWSVRDIQ
jgi:putative phage-type endonuclease